MQSVKLLMQSRVLVANVVRKHDLGEAWISYDQFDVTEKHSPQHPYRWWMFLIATGFGPDIRKPVLQPSDHRRPNRLLGWKMAKHRRLG
jgi:hypothetical protein